MRRLVIVCEGETEQAFCREVLAAYLTELAIEAPLIKKSGGGIVAWASIRKQIKMHLREGNCFVTTFFDFYGIEVNHEFPHWAEAQQLKDKYEQIKLIEAGMRDAIDANMRNRFIPYLQLHEFEALLFSNQDAMFNAIPTIDESKRILLEEIFKNFPNPELINKQREASPSHRLLSLIIGYDKIIYGTILAEAIGIDAMLASCPHFSEWIKKLKELQ